MSGVDGGTGKAGGQHRFAHAGRADEQHVGGVVEEPQSGQIVDEFGINGWLGVKVKVGQPPGCRKGGEPFQAGLASLVGGIDLDGQQPFQKRGVGQLGGVGVFQFAGQRLGCRTKFEVGQMAAELLVERGLTHDRPPLVASA